MRLIHLKYFNYYPIVGIILYVLTYCYAITFYPGGSIDFPNAARYSFSHNLLCDAMDVLTPNGTYNAARPFAIAAHFA